MPTRFRLREVLEKRQMTQTEIARLSKISFATINRMCTNATSQVSLATLDAIAEALGVEPGELIAREKRNKR